MKQPDREMLSGAAAETLEKLTLMLCSIEGDDMWAAPEERGWAGASVTFDGPSRGSLILLFSDDIVHEIAANMLGSEDEPPTRDQEKDAMGEAANVLCGNLLPLIFGDDVVFSIGSPRSWGGKGLARIPEGEGAFQPFFEMTLSVEEGLCRIFLFVK